MPVEDLYEQLQVLAGSYEWGGKKYPSLVEPRNAADMILYFAPETNGEVVYRGFQDLERGTGLRLADLAEESRAIRYDFDALLLQPRRFLTSPCWSGILNRGRAYSAYCLNVERGVPWRTLTGRQHLYLDHEGYRAFGESLPNCLTPHGKWHIHTTYSDDLRMLTLSRGIEPFWLNDKDAAEIRSGTISRWRGQSRR